MSASRVFAPALIVAAVFASPVAAADVAAQLFDLNPGLATGVGNVVQGAAVFGGQLYFQGSGSNGNNELWRYDGINPPVQAMDLNPSGNSTPEEPTVFGARLCFNANDSTFDREVYCLDGVNPPVKLNVRPSGSSTPTNFTVWNGNLYFMAEGDTFGRELWRWDGAATPVRVSDIAPGGSNAFDTDQYDDPVIWGGHLYLVAYNGSNRELYRYDGSNPPVMISSSAGNAYGDSLVVAGSYLYFVHSDSSGQGRLWRYDGTNPPVQLSATLDVEGDLISYGDNLYLFALETLPGSETNREMWKLDGNGLGRVAPGHSFGLGTASWRVYAGRLYFMDGAELYRYDGSGAPTVAVSSFAAPADYPNNGFVGFAGALFFSARHDTGGGGSELWALVGDFRDGFESGNLTIWSARTTP